MHVVLHNPLAETPDSSSRASRSRRTAWRRGRRDQTYSFTAANPGTYLYEAAPLPNAQHQTAMGLHGALVIQPAAAGQAYADAATAYDADAVLVMSELDPALNVAANPADFDMRTFTPRYVPLNGRAYPDTDPIAATVETPSCCATSTPACPTTRWPSSAPTRR